MKFAYSNVRDILNLSLKTLIHPGGKINMEGESPKQEKSV